MTPSALVTFSPTPQARRSTGTALIEPPAGGRSSMVISCSLVSISSSPPTPSYFRRSVIGKVVQSLRIDHNPAPPPPLSTVTPPPTRWWVLGEQKSHWSCGVSSHPMAHWLRWHQIHRGTVRRCNRSQRYLSIQSEDWNNSCGFSR